jgi:hypothetical protein
MTHPLSPKTIFPNQPETEQSGQISMQKIMEIVKNYIHCTKLWSRGYLRATSCSCFNNIITSASKTTTFQAHFCRAADARKARAVPAFFQGADAKKIDADDGCPSSGLSLMNLLWRSILTGSISCTASSTSLICSRTGAGMDS